MKRIVVCIIAGVVGAAALTTAEVSVEASAGSSFDVALELSKIEGGRA